MKAVNPYLNFSGNCEEAFNFYKSVFGGEFVMLMRFKDVPAEEMDTEHQLPDSEGEKIMHVSLPVAQGTILMGSDVPSAMGTINFGNSFSIAISTDSEAEADAVFDGLSAGGQITMPLDKTFWGAYFGMLTDKFGVQWMVSYDYNQ
ncbi:MAG TPA: VOC family protein [Anaerolineae bacterium]|nr:VOC family protein [Anaerolineae bacterium]MCB9107752.1 VOC family protein [Anaerolineales bacterium]HRV93300.1 VOC family protein [Anaerolineae bacterium]